MPRSSLPFQSLLAGLLVLVATAAPRDARAEPAAVPTYEIRRTTGPIAIDGVLDDPSWLEAAPLTDFAFPWHDRGAQEQTSVKLLWDDDHLYVAIVCHDAHVTATAVRHDVPLGDDDCVELIVAPDPALPTRYFNIEWSPAGGCVDAYRPEGKQGPRRADWDPAGMRVGRRVAGTPNDDGDTDDSWTIEAAIPLASFDVAGAPRPHAGCTWGMNVNRHGGRTNPQYSQWSAGDTPKPSFHTPHRWGRGVFSASPAGTDPAGSGPTDE